MENLRSTIRDLRSSEIEILEEGLDFRVVEGLGEQGMAEEGAEFSLAGKVLEFGIIDNDGAREWACRCGVDDGFERRFGLGGDDFGQREARGIGERIESLEP